MCNKKRTTISCHQAATQPWIQLWQIICCMCVAFSSVCILILRVVCCEIPPPATCFFFFFLIFPIFLCLLLYRELLFVPRYLNGSHVLQLGGVSENVSYEFPQLQHKHFTGCIRNLLVDSKVQWGACFKLAKLTQQWSPLMNRFHCFIPLLSVRVTDDMLCTPEECVFSFKATLINAWGTLKLLVLRLFFLFPLIYYA